MQVLFLFRYQPAQGWSSGTMNRSKRKIRLTSTGHAFIAVIAVVLGLSYWLSISLMFLVGTMFTGMFLYNALHVHFNTRGLRVKVTEVPDLFAGETATMSIQIKNRKRGMSSHHLEIHLVLDHGRSDPVFLDDIGGNQAMTAKVQVIPERRGWFQVKAFQCHTAYPFGMWRASIDIPLRERLLVYPPLLARLPVILRSERIAKGLAPHNSGDYQYLSTYQPGDDVRLIHWRKSTLSEKPVLKRDLIQTEMVEPRVFLPDPCDHFEYAISAMATYFHSHDSSGWSIYTNDGIHPLEGPEEMLRYLALVQPLPRKPDLGTDRDLYTLFASQVLPG